MNLILSGRGVELDDSLREYATEKLTRAQRFFDRIIKMEVELRHGRNPRVPDSVEITVKTPGETLRVHGEGLDHRAAIDVAADKLESQMRKHKERLVDHHTNHHRSQQPAAPLPDDDDDGPEIVRLEPPLDKPVSPEEAALELDSRGYGFLMFLDTETMRPAVIFKQKDGTYGLFEYKS